MSERENENEAGGELEPAETLSAEHVGRSGFGLPETPEPELEPETPEPEIEAGGELETPEPVDGDELEAGGEREDELETDEPEGEGITPAAIERALRAGPQAIVALFYGDPDPGEKLCPTCNGSTVVSIAPRHHGRFEGCESCGMSGYVLTGSHVPGHETIECPDCAARGFRDKGQAWDITTPTPPPLEHAAEHEAGNGNGDVTPGLEPPPVQFYVPPPAAVT